MQRLFYSYLLSFLLCVAMLMQPGSVHAQNREKDSLLNLLKIHSKEDTTRALLMSELGFVYTQISADSALYYGEQGSALSKKLNYMDGYVRGKSVMGLVYRDRGRENDAIKIYQEIIEIRTRQGKKDKLMGAFSNLATVYLVQKKFPLAIKNFEKAIELAKTNKDEANELVILGNLALTYQEMGDMDKAFALLSQCLEMNKKLKDEVQEANLLTNIAIIYQQKGNTSAAVAAYSRAKSIYEKYGYLKGVLDNSVNLMNCYNRNDEFEKALSEANYAEELCIQNADSFYLAEVYICKANALHGLNRFSETAPLITYVIQAAGKYNNPKMASVGNLVFADHYKSTGKLDKAIEHALIGKAYADTLQEPRQLEDANYSLYQLFNLKKDFKSALSYLEKVVVLRDSTNNQDFNSKLANLKSLYDLDAKEKEIALLNKDNALYHEKDEKKNFLIMAGAVVGILLVVVLFLAYRAYRRKKKDNVILESQKSEIELKNSILHEKNEEIVQQKYMLEEKNKEIIDSMNYAQRIQSALLASENLLSRNLGDYFVYYKPKSIVSGDFYWATEIRKLKPGKMFADKGSSDVKGVGESSDFILVCGDCTGHGVPGAFMSLLNISKLNETINEKKVKVPGQILDAVRKEIISVLNPHAQSAVENSQLMQDGMDCALVRLNRDEMTLTYAAANNPVYIIRSGTLHTCPADKMPVGKSPSEDKPFSTYTVEVKPGDMVYLMTDGFADQFGGPKGKKFKYKPLEELFIGISAKTGADQHEILRQKFSEWVAWPGSHGEIEQIDDILIIGFRV